MKKKLLFSACACMAVVLGLGCSEVNGVPSRAPSGYPEGPKTMVDAGATAITRTLYENLFVLAERGTMFGHQIPTLYGLDNNRKWWAGDDTDLSDTKYLTGSHPAVCGWELSNIEYCMLAFGWSGSGDTASGNAFRATRPIQLGDTTWLHINQMFEDLRYDDAKKSVTGTLTLNFDDDLYYLDNSTNPPELISLDITPMGTHGQTDKFQSVANYIQHAPEISLSTDALKKDRLVRELTFTFTGASARSYIRFDMNLSDASQNVHKQYQLMVQLNVDPDTGKVDVNITPEWDGRVLPE